MLRKKRILVVDDEESFTRGLRLNLEATGRYEVREENQSTHALASAQEFQPDVILLDVVMPNLDGSEVAAQIKADQSLRSTLVIFLTAVASKSEVGRKSGMIGGNPFIAKPANVEEVVTCIEHHFKLKQG